MISIIAAVAKNSVIGYRGKIPWNLPADQKNFRELTLHNPVIMGYKTFKSLKKPLHDRINIVVSKNKNLKLDNCIVNHSISAAIETAKAKTKKEIFIIGGAQIYEQAIDFVDKIYMSEINQEPKGDTYFPTFRHKYKCVSRQKKPGYNYCIWEKRWTDSFNKERISSSNELIVR